MGTVIRRRQEAIWKAMSFPDRELENVKELYARFEVDLRRVRAFQRRLYESRDEIGLEPQLGDIEAEMTYLLIRAHRPANVVEISPASGWSTTWILNALADNAFGQLHSYDLVDDSLRSVPVELARGRWRFTKGDVREAMHLLPETVDYLFIDSDHSADFAHWYLSCLFPRVRGARISAHDIMKWHDEPGWGWESPVLCRWLAEQSIACLTASRTLPEKGFRDLSTLRDGLGLGPPILASDYNSMVFFALEHVGSGSTTEPVSSL